MGRKSTVAHEVENPLYRMFGTFLRLKRALLGYSSEEIGVRLNLSSTYVRLVESGRAMLNENLVFAMIEIFANSKTAARPTSVSFSRLAMYLVGARWVGCEIVSNPDRPNTAQRALESLAARESDFEAFLGRVSGYFEAVRGEDGGKRFLETVAVSELEFFLSGAPLTGNLHDLREVLLPSRDLFDLPTLNAEVWLGLKESLVCAPFIHVGEAAARWELQSASRFRFLRGVYRESDLIINADNLRLFRYPYLRQPRFAGIQMVFLDNGVDAETLKEKFVRIANEVQTLPLSETEISKISFVCASAGHLQSRMDDLLRPVHASGSDSNAYWSFETHSGLSHGFACGNPSNVRNLSVGDSFARNRLFQDIWSSCSEN